MEEVIHVPTTDGFEVIKVRHIIRCESFSNYTKFLLSTGKTMLSTKTLKYYTNLWHGTSFFRVHRSHLINISHIIKYHKGKYSTIEMSDKSFVPLSRRGKTKFVKHFI